MARISIDDELHADPRFKRLLRKLGDEDKAVGILYRFWRIAQDHWGDGKLVPAEEFKLEEFDVLLAVDFAELRETGYYAHGSEERFAWHLQRCNASKKGVEARKTNRTTESGQPEPSSRSTGTIIPVNPSLLSAPAPASLRTDKKKEEEASGEPAASQRDLFGKAGAKKPEPTPAEIEKKARDIERARSVDSIYKWQKAICLENGFTLAEIAPLDGKLRGRYNSIIEHFADPENGGDGTIWCGRAYVAFLVEMIGQKYFNGDKFFKPLPFSVIDDTRKWSVLEGTIREFIMKGMPEKIEDFDVDAVDRLNEALNQLNPA